VKTNVGEGLRHDFGFPVAQRLESCRDCHEYIGPVHSAKFLHVCVKDKLGRATYLFIFRLCLF
jgi:hypothetical protein